MEYLDEPPILAVGTEVSAKFKGAFCEAKIRNISKTVKCKVQYSNGVSKFVTDDAVKGQLKVGATVDIKCNDKKELVRATIQKIQDCSQYTVVFNDGDIACLKRTALCLKSERHFANSATLDKLPLTHPEHIGVTPIRTTILQNRRSRTHKKSIGESGEKESSTMEKKDIGKVVCVETKDKKKVKDNWFPGLIVAPTSQSLSRTNVAENYLVRSFKDGKYYTIPKNESNEFTKEIGARVENHTLKTAVEKALLFIDKDELPPHWDRNVLFDDNKMYIGTHCESFDSDNSDKESIEEKDHFVALVFKFMDDRGTPLNQAPMIDEKYVDLYKLFKVVNNNCGGYNKVNKNELWKFVAYKTGHEKQSFISVKFCYQQYLHDFEDFYRKLGCSMLNHQRAERSRSSFSRSIIRDVDKALPSTSSATDKIKCAKNQLKDKKNEGSAVIKKTAKAIKNEEKLVKNNEKTSKKGQKEMNNIANSTSNNKPSIKWDPEITETKDPVRNSKTKEMTEILKKKIKKEIDSDEEDDDQIIEYKKLEKNIYTRNLFGKSVQRITEKEKVIKLKSADTGLPGVKKMRATKEKIKNVVREMTPFNKSERKVSNTQQDVSNKVELDEGISKLTRSKTKEELPTKSKRVSVLSNLGESVSVVQLAQPGLLAKNLIKIKKEHDNEKKKTGRKKKGDHEDKAFSNDINLTLVNIENVPFDKDSPVVDGDNIVVYYGKQATTYNAKVLCMCDIEGVMKYYIHYMGWNARYDEWIDVTRIAYKTKNREPKPEVDNDADSSKFSPTEQKMDLKKVSATSSRTRSSVTPLTSNSSIKKSPFSRTRPIRTCTLIDPPIYNIDDSDSEEEYIVSVGSSNQYSKKKVIKSEPTVILKTEPLDTDDDDENKMLYPNIYNPSKEVLMQESAPLMPKSSVFKVHTNKSKEVDVCKQVTLDNENVEAQNENNVDDGVQIELKITPNHCLSPKVKSEKYDLDNFSESSKCGNEEVRIKSEPYSSSSEDEEQNQLKNVTDIISSSIDDKFGESKTSGTNFYLNKIRSDMKGIMPTLTNIDNDITRNTESFILDQQIEIEVPKVNEPVTNDVYEFEESEMCNFDSLSSATEEKLCRSIRHNSPKLFDLKKPDKQQRVIDSSTQEKLVEQNRSMVPFVPNSNIIYSFDNNIETVNDNLNIIYEIKNPNMINQSDNESFQNTMISEVIVDTPNIKEFELHFQDEVNVSDLQYEVLDLCMKPPKSPPTNIFSIPEPYELNDMIIEEEYDDEDYGLSKLVIAENDKMETDYLIDSNIVVITEEHNSSNVQIDENIEAQSLPPLRQESKISSQVKRHSIQKDTDDESTTFRNESIPNSHIQRNHSSLNRLYMDDNDENTKTGFKFYSTSKSPLLEVREIVEPSINDMPKKCDFEVKNVKDKYIKKKTKWLPELQCIEEIVEEDTLNNVSIIEYNCKSAEYDIHRPSTSKGFFDSIYQPSTSKDNFYETDTSSNTKNNFFETSEAVKNVIFDTNVPGKSSFFDPNIPSCSTKDFYNHYIPCTSKSNLYENSLPSTSKSFYNPEFDVNNALFCEEMIPGSPTSTLEEQYDQKERKKALLVLYEEREAASAMYAMKQSFCRPMITLMGATEEEMKEYTNILQKDGAILDQQHLLFLAKISGRKLGININELSVTEPLDREPETIVEKIVKTPEKLQSKRKISSHEQTSKRNKLSTTTASIPSGSHVEKPNEEKTPNPLFVLPVYPPEMTSAERQADLINKMNGMRKVHKRIQGKLAKVARNKKKIEKRKREKAKADRQSQATSNDST